MEGRLLSPPALGLSFGSDQAGPGHLCPGLVEGEVPVSRAVPSHCCQWPCGIISTSICCFFLVFLPVQYWKFPIVGKGREAVCGRGGSR